MKKKLFIKGILFFSCLLWISSFSMIADDQISKGHQLVNINTASAKELTSIPGVGKVLAQRIIAFREKNGPFKKIEDLMKVRGIGERNFKKMKDLITVGKASKKKS